MGDLNLVNRKFYSIRKHKLRLANNRVVRGYTVSVKTKKHGGLVCHHTLKYKDALRFAKEMSYNPNKKNMKKKKSIEGLTSYEGDEGVYDEDSGTYV